MVSIVFIQRHVDEVTTQMTANVLVELNYLKDSVEAVEMTQEAWAVARRLGPELDVSVSFPASGENTDARFWWDMSAGAVQRSLREGMSGVVAIDLKRSHSRVYMRIETTNGPMDLRFSRSRVSASNPHQLLVLMVFTGLLMTMISYLFLRNQLRPITRLAAAAEAFGKGRHIPYRPAGASEVRQAGLAFLDMRERIDRHIDQRTLMLSGVSHDLRTPLTRMTLALSMLDDNEDTQALRRDVADMERLVDEFLSFARGDAVEGAEPIDAAGLVSQVVESALQGGQSVELAHCDPTGDVALRPMAVKRALENLIGNAIQYGRRAWVSVDAMESSIRIRVEDDGPGIPEAQRAEAVQAFARLDPARNQNLPGVGLGLSIAADIARSHGGQLRLSRSVSHGGLRADLLIAR